MAPSLFSPGLNKNKIYFTSDLDSDKNNDSPLIGLHCLCLFISFFSSVAIVAVEWIRAVMI